MIQKKVKVLPSAGLRITYNGSFDFDKLYKALKKWFDSNNYEFIEKEQKIKDKAAGKEITLTLECTEDYDDYAQFNIKVKAFFEQVNKVDGLDNGNGNITFYAFVDLDRKNKWQGSKFNKLLFFMYNNFIIRKKIKDLYEDTVYKDVIDAMNVVKENLGLMKEG